MARVLASLPKKNLLPFVALSVPVVWRHIFKKSYMNNLFSAVACSSLDLLLCSLLFVHDQCNKLTFHPDDNRNESG